MCTHTYVLMAPLSVHVCVLVLLPAVSQSTPSTPSSSGQRTKIQNGSSRAQIMLKAAQSGTTVTPRGSSASNSTSLFKHMTDSFSTSPSSSSSHKSHGSSSLFPPHNNRSPPTSASRADADDQYDSNEHPHWTPAASAARSLDEDMRLVKEREQREQDAKRVQDLNRGRLRTLQILCISIDSLC